MHIAKAGVFIFIARNWLGELSCLRHAELLNAHPRKFGPRYHTCCAARGKRIVWGKVALRLLDYCMRNCLDFLRLLFIKGEFVHLSSHTVQNFSRRVYRCIAWESSDIVRLWEAP